MHFDAFCYKFSPPQSVLCGFTGVSVSFIAGQRNRQTVLQQHIDNRCRFPDIFAVLSCIVAYELTLSVPPAANLCPISSLRVSILLGY